MKLSKTYTLRQVAGENILVNGGQCINYSAVFSLNDTAAWLWNRIGDCDFEEEDLVRWICDEYEVDEAVAREDVHNMILLWKQYGMIAS